MKRVLIFSFAYFPHVGGAEVAVREITKRIPETEIEFDMITFRFGSEPVFEKIGNVNVYRVGVLGKYFFPLFSCLKALILHRKNRYDAIWAIMANYAGFGAMFFKVWNSNVPFLLTLQEGDPIPYIKKKVRLVSPLFRQIFKKADHIQAISNYLADFGREFGAKCPIDVVSNGVPFEKFGLRNLQSELEKKNELKIAEEDKVVITTSRLVEKNGVGDLIDAMEFLPENVKLLILGSGLQESALKNRAERFGKRIIFIGSVPYEKIPQYLHISHVFCRPSLSEGMGNSFIEAMAAGLPVVATKVGGIPDFLKDGETGLFCEVRNSQSIAEKIKIFLQNGGLRERIIENGRLLAKKYDWNLISENIKVILTKL